MMSNIGGFWSLTSLYILLFWIGLVLLAVWLYQQFQDKKGAVILAAGLILTLGTLLLATLVTGGMGGAGGMMGMMNSQGMKNVMKEMMQDSDIKALMGEMMNEKIEGHEESHHKQ